MQFRRHAIYHLPEGPLGDFGAAWLGWDARRGCAAPAPDLPGLPDDRAALVAQPARYGFHATLKAPFRIAPAHGPEDLLRRAELVCDHLAPFELRLELSAEAGFLALRPDHQPPALVALEQALVTRLDDLRAPLSSEERDRRGPDRLSDLARQHLDHWGYPWVLGLFRYHLTLSGPVTPAQAQAAAEWLGPCLAPLIAQPMPVRAVALMGEDEAGRFHCLAEIPLRAKASCAT